MHHEPPAALVGARASGTVRRPVGEKRRPAAGWPRRKPPPQPPTLSLLTVKGPDIRTVIRKHRVALTVPATTLELGPPPPLSA